MDVVKGILDMTEDQLWCQDALHSLMAKITLIYVTPRNILIYNMLQGLINIGIKIA